jgi:hypothetical protein
MKAQIVNPVTSNVLGTYPNMSHADRAVIRDAQDWACSLNLTNVEIHDDDGIWEVKAFNDSYEI